MERPSGPLGAATQSSRPMTDNGLPRAAPLNTARRVPNAVRHAQSSSSLSKQKPLSAAEVIALAREAMKVAVDEHAEVVKAEGLNVPGVTIDLSHKLIQIFPEEVVDIIKNELERFALSHNQITTFPSRFAECTSLRYLNIRNNSIREFPESICQLKALEILDLGRNKLRVLPVQLAQLTSLKVLSVQRNRLETLPVCIADMTPLQILKLEGNPLRFPPKELLPLQTQTSPNGGSQDTNEVDDMAVTIQVKKILKQKVANRSETESGGEESSEGTETPRPVRRVMSGRFPIKVNGTEVPDMRSPAFPPRPPPIPSRSHYRQLSQQNAALRRPGVMPLTIGSANERLRSNSEGLLPDTRDPNRPAERSRRMGIVSKRAQELGTVDELKANNRYSHHGRGLSHGSAMSVGTNGSTRSPASPADSVLGRATYVKRLSSLPERKRESTSVDPVIEAAKSILYALFQVHPLIQSLLGVARDETKRRTSLERVFFNANSHVEDLDRHIQIYDTYTEEDEEAAPRSNENIHRTCVDCVSAYVHVCGLLQSNVQALLENGDPRYIRTLLLNVYGSIAEIRNASEAFARAREPVDGMPGMEDGRARIVLDETLRPARLNLDRAVVRTQYVTSTREQPGTTPRSRSGTTIQRPPNLQVSTDQQLPAPNGIGRSNVFANNSNFGPSLTNGIDRATPRSGESFASSASGSRIMGGDYTEEDLKWESIFLALRGNVDLTLRNMPIVKDHFTAAMQLNDQRDRPQVPTAAWQKLIAKGDEWINAAAFLKNRLSQIKLNQPGVRTQPSFWQSCAKFVEVYTDFILDVKKIKQQSSLFPNQVVDLIRPLQKEIKSTSAQIFNSPWANLAHANNGQPNGSTQSPASQVPLPMTPQSAALGPAVQATVPSTPGSATFVNMPSYYGQSQTGQRSNTMTYGVANLSLSNSRENTMTSASGGLMLGPNDGTRAPQYEQSRRGRGRGILEGSFDIRPNAPLTPLPVMNEAQQRAIAQDNERRKRERGANGDRISNDNGDSSGGSGSGEPIII